MRIDLPAHFSLTAAADFYTGFTPGSGMAALTDDGVTLAFSLDGTFEPVVARLAQAGRVLHVEHSPVGSAARLRDQLARMLGLDVDGDAWLALGQRDPVVGAMQARYAGFFTAAKLSPYDAATWGIIAPRLGMVAAARIKQRIAAEHGHRVTLRGREHAIFPSPERLLAIDALPALPDVKHARLRGIAEAALRGELDADRLVALGERAAVAALQRLDGVGPWVASHIYYRGAAPTDGMPCAEPRVMHAFAAAYETPPSVQSFLEHAEAWRPFRMWVVVLLMRELQRTGRWHIPSLPREGRRLR